MKMKTSKATPLALLLSALFMVFLFGNDRSHFYRMGWHSNLSSFGMNLAANLSLKHNFLTFEKRYLDENNKPSYIPHNRFPTGAFALIKLVSIPFEKSYEKQIYAARLLMLSFFCAAAILAFLILCQIVSNPWIALTATLWSFSSYYCLYYNDVIFNDVPSLFGLLLTCHGCLLFSQKGHFWQLVLKTCLALFFSWHSYALVLPFLLFDFINKTLLKRNGEPGAGKAKNFISSFSRQNSPLINLVLMLVFLLFGSALLLFNFTNEYLALDGKFSFKDLPSLQSARNRLGLNPEFRHHPEGLPLSWWLFLKIQFHHISAMSAPFLGFSLKKQTFIGMIPLMAGVGFTFYGWNLVRQKILFLSLILSGPFWHLLMRNYTTFHNFQSLFYMGIPLGLGSISLLLLYRRFGKFFLIGSSLCMWLLFVFSSFQMGKVGNIEYPGQALGTLPDDHIEEKANFQREILSDFSAISPIVKDKSVFVQIPQPSRNTVFVENSIGKFNFFTSLGMAAQIELSGAMHGLYYYLSGSLIGESKPAEIHPDGPKPRRGEAKSSSYDFLLTGKLDSALGKTLTPKNRHLFLYKMR